jgi:hypothetical protein
MSEFSRIFFFFTWYVPFIYLSGNIERIYVSLAHLSCQNFRLVRQSKFYPKGPHMLCWWNWNSVFVLQSRTCLLITGEILNLWRGACKGIYIDILSTCDQIICDACVRRDILYCYIQCKVLEMLICVAYVSCIRGSLNSNQLWLLS